MDAYTNFAVATVATAPSPASSGTSLVVASGQGARFPAPPFNASVWPADALPTPANAEIVRVTDITSDTLTISRAEESTTARSITVGDLIAATITKKTLDDLPHLDALNVFTRHQTIAEPATSNLTLAPTSAPVDARRFDLTVDGATFNVEVLTDAGTITATPLSLTRAGDATVQGTLTAAGLGATPLNATNLTSGTVPAARLPARIGAIGLVIDGGGAVITTGVKGFLEVPFACTITAATLLSTDAAVTSGSIVIDIWKDTYANYAPTVADTITASAKPTLSSAIKSRDTNLTGWTTAIAAGDVLGFKVDSVTTVTRVTLSLTVQAT